MAHGDRTGAQVVHEFLHDSFKRPPGMRVSLIVLALWAAAASARPSNSMVLFDIPTVIRGEDGQLIRLTLGIGESLEASAARFCAIPAVAARVPRASCTDATINDLQKTLLDLLV